MPKRPNGRRPEIEHSGPDDGSSHNREAEMPRRNANVRTPHRPREFREAFIAKVNGEVRNVR